MLLIVLFIALNRGKYEGKSPHNINVQAEPAVQQKKLGVHKRVHLYIRSSVNTNTYTCSSVNTHRHAHIYTHNSHHSHTSVNAHKHHLTHKDQLRHTYKHILTHPLTRIN